jgi:hypothetical protein
VYSDALAFGTCHPQARHISHDHRLLARRHTNAESNFIASWRSDFKAFQAGLRKLGLAWTAAIEVSSLELIDLYTSLGFGVGLSVAVPGLRRKSGLHVLPLRKFAPLTIAALWSGDLSARAATFLASIKRLASRLGR